MKKFASVVLSIVILMLSSLTVWAENTGSNQWNLHQASYENENETEIQEVEDGELTLELLQRTNSWEELVNTTLPISDQGWKKIKNREDYYCVMLIESINKKMIAHIYHDQEYISVGLGGIKCKEIDCDRLLHKYKEIIRIYNESNKLQLVWETKPLSFDCIQINIESTNVAELERPATMIGQKVVVKEGTVYWQSADNDGTGNFGVITDDDCVATVNGVAYYTDKNCTKIEECIYSTFNELGEKEDVYIETYKFRMLHICTKNSDLGWVYPESCVAARTCK